MLVVYRKSGGKVEKSSSGKLRDALKRVKKLHGISLVVTVRRWVALFVQPLTVIWNSFKHSVIWRLLGRQLSQDRMQLKLATSNLGVDIVAELKFNVNCCDVTATGLKFDSRWISVISDCMIQSTYVRGIEVNQH